MVYQHVIYSEKPNAFSMIFEANFPFWNKIDAFGIGVYKVVWMRLPSSQKAVFYWFYKVSRLGENATRKPSLGNAFSMILEAFLRFWTSILSFDLGFDKVLWMRLPTSQQAVFLLVL